MRTKTRTRKRVRKRVRKKVRKRRDEGTKGERDEEPTKE